MKPEEPGPLKDKKVKAELQAQYSAVIDDGIKNLQKALDIDPNYDDAMAYMNLLIREKADLDDTPRSVQEGRRHGRQLGAEGARYQEDESRQEGSSRGCCRGGITTDEDAGVKLTAAGSAWLWFSITWPIR